MKKLICEVCGGNNFTKEEGEGAIILMPRSPFITFRLKLSRYAENPAPWVASGFCMAMSRQLLKL